MSIPRTHLRTACNICLGPVDRNRKRGGARHPYAFHRGFRNYLFCIIVFSPFDLTRTRFSVRQICYKLDGSIRLLNLQRVG